MENMTAGLQTVLQILPLGDWLTKSPYGIVYGTLLFDTFSGVILLLSKLILKEYFVSAFRKKMIIFGAGGTAFLMSACYMYILIKLVPALSSQLITKDFSYLLPIYYTLTFIAYIFFIGYLIDFVIRIVRHIRSKKKENITAE